MHPESAPPVRSVQRVTVEELAARPHAPIVELEALTCLASPDSGLPLAFRSEGPTLSDGTHHYSFRGRLPLLVPERLQSFFSDRLVVPAVKANDAFLQYFLLASLRQAGDINASSDSEHFQRHLFRMRDFIGPYGGLVLDVGCDDPGIGASLFPPDARYIGLDPFCCRPEPFRLIGFAEYLPVLAESMDTVVFNTSLDHIFDWHRALDEAHRVLRESGELLIASLAWTSRADLLTDSVHFHHFGEYELLGALSQFEITDVRRFDYKGDTHRYGLYIRARKRVV